MSDRQFGMPARCTAFGKSMPKGSLVGFCTTCLYFAALTLWMYSNVYSTMSLCLDTQQRSKEGHLFVLDSQVDSPALGRFILSRLGFPALNSKEGTAYLNNNAAVMRLFQEVLWSKHPGGTVHSQTWALYNAFSALGNRTSCPRVVESNGGSLICQRNVHMKYAIPDTKYAPLAHRCTGISNQFVADHDYWSLVMRQAWSQSTVDISKYYRWYEYLH